MKKAKKTKKWLVNIVSFLLVVFCLCVISYNVCLSSIVVSGSSMNPTLNNLEYGVMNTISLRKKSIKRFDIIIFEKKHDSNAILIKRIIGLPNEKIRIDSENGELFINDKAVKQKFLAAYPDLLADTCNSSTMLACDTNYMIPNNEYYVLGDNRRNSQDSEHGLGTIAYEQIHGVLFAIQGTCREIVEDKSGYDVCVGKKSSVWRFY